jgi:hypothetical protein
MKSPSKSSYSIIILFLFIAFSCKKDNETSDVILDEIAPSILVIYPASQSVLMNEITITMDAEDNKGIRRTECYIDGKIFGLDSIPPYSFIWNTNLEKEGTHTIFGKAIDLSGNSGQSELVTVTTSHPVLEVPVLIFPNNSEYTDSTNVKLVWNKVPNAKDYTLQISTDSTFSSNVTSVNISDTSVYKDIVPKKINYWKVQANSAYGDKSSWSKCRSFAVPLYLMKDITEYKAYGLSIKNSGDGGYLIFGSVMVNYKDWQVPQLFVLKINPQGDKVWYKEFPNYQIDIQADCKITLDKYGNIYISGEYWNEIKSLQGFVMKLNKYGNLLWKKEYVDFKTCFPRSIFALDEGGVIVCAVVDSNEEPSSTYDWLFVLSENGDLEWEKRFSWRGKGLFIAMQIQDKNYISFTGDSIYKFQQDGTILWKKSHDFGSCNRGLPTSDGGIIINRGNALGKFNKDGIMEWSKKSNKYYTDWASFSIRLTSDNNYLLYGNVSNELSYLTKINFAGSEIWTKDIIENKMNGFINAIEATNGNYLLLSNRNPYLITLTKNGEISDY